MKSFKERTKEAAAKNKVLLKAIKKLDPTDPYRIKVEDMIKNGFDDLDIRDLMLIREFGKNGERVVAALREPITEIE